MHTWYIDSLGDHSIDGLGGINKVLNILNNKLKCLQYSRLSYKHDMRKDWNFSSNLCLILLVKLVHKWNVWNIPG